MILSINSNFCGIRVATPDYPWQLIFLNGVERFSQVSADVSDVEGDTFSFQLTGMYIYRNGSNFYQTTTGKFVEWNEKCQIIAKSNEKYGVINAQNQVNSIIKNNRRIYENNLLCARFSHLLTSSQVQTLKDLQFRMIERDAALRNQKLLTNIKVSYPKGYIELYPYLEQLDLSGSIGSISLSATAYIVIGAVVIASLATAAYWAYSYYYQQALQDVKYSDELTAILKGKLTDKEYQQLKEETAGMVTKSNIAGRFSGVGSVIKYAALAFAGYVVYKTIQENQ